MRQERPHVTLKGLSKIYNLKHGKSTLVESILKRKKSEKYKALDNINLTIKKGERVGVIGVNGSGKTTLLKILAGITKPSHGSVGIGGKIVSLIDLSAGFHPDLTGEENILLNGLLVGMEKEEICRLKSAIIEYADIGGFIDSPLFTYSEGMKLRLGFSIAVHANPDILLMDEGVAVGDKNFHVKCKIKLLEYAKKKKTVIMTSHWIPFLEEYCDRVIWLEKGKVKMDGKSGEVISKYMSYHETEKNG